MELIRLMRGKFRKGFFTRLLLSLMVISCLFVRFDSLYLTPIGNLVIEYRFDVSGWELRNIFDKWWHKYRLTGDSSSLSRYDRLKQVESYLTLNSEEMKLISEAKATLQSDPLVNEKHISDKRLDDIRQQQSSIRHVVEDVLEAEVGAVLLEQELPLRVPLLKISFPPVDFRLDVMPHILITSARDEINMKESILLKSRISRSEKETIENEILETQNLSALVENLGGLATYPALISNSHDLRFILNTVAHEWLHQFFFFHPLGQNFSKSPDMASLNETAANLVGSEIGGLVMERVLMAMPSLDNHQINRLEEVYGDKRFNFSEEMRETRLEVEKLLKNGEIYRAEQYMEERRLFMADNGFYIRKLNQAYFAFHGRYGDSPSSVSDIADELREMRRLLPSLKSFVEAISGVGSYKEFKDLKHNLLVQH